MGDRIVEVNGVNVGLENHKQVVARIKAVHDDTALLVVDKACDDYHTLHEIVVTSSLAHVVRLYDRDGMTGTVRDVTGLDLNRNEITKTQIGNDQVTTDVHID